MWTIWGNPVTGYMPVTLCQSHDYLLICHCVGDLRKPCYRSHVSDPMSVSWLFTDMSLCGRSEETLLQVTCEWPYVNLMTIYWYVTVWTIWGNPVTGHMRVTLCQSHDYLLIWEIQFMTNQILKKVEWIEAKWIQDLALLSSNISLFSKGHIFRDPSI